MAVYRITAPDGGEYEVTAPDDASEQDVLAYAQQQFSQPAARKPAPPQTGPGGKPLSADPTDGRTWRQNFVDAYGGGVPTLARGARQLATEAAQFVGQGYGVPSGVLEPEVQRLRAESDKIRALEAPLQAAPGGLWGSIAGNTAPMLVAPNAALTSLGRAAPYANAAIQGAGFGAAQPVGAEGSRAQNAGLGALLGAGGQGIAAGASGLARGAVSRLDDMGRTLADKASQAGIRLGLGQVSSNPVVRTVASQMERLPFSGGRGRAENNQEAFNQAVGAQFGADSRKLTPDVFAEAKQAVSRQFDDLTERNSLVPTPQVIAQVQRIVSDAGKMGTSDTQRIVSAHVNELVGKVGADGAVPGRAFREFDTMLGQKLKTGGDPAHYLGQLRDVIRRAMDDSISPADQAAWREVRQKWAALKTVEPLVAKTETGDIAPAQLLGRTTADAAGKVRMANDRGGEMGDLARIGQRFLKQAPNSGTADRLVVNLGVIGALSGGAHTGVISPEQAMWTAALLGGNRAALKAMSSKGIVSGQSKTLTGLARLVQPAPRALPAAGLPLLRDENGVLDLGTVHGYER